MAKFDDFLDDVIEGTKDLAKSSLNDMRNEAVKDGKAFLKKAEKDLKRWTKLLRKGDLSEKEFRWLLKGKKGLAKMEVLKQSGLAQIRINKFVNGLMDLIVDKAVATFL